MPPPISTLSAADYKAAKEAFVSGLNGGSMLEISLMSLPVAASLWAYAEVKAVCQLFGCQPSSWSSSSSRTSSTPLSDLVTFLAEFTLLVFPLLLTQTLPNLSLVIALALVVLACVLQAIVRGCKEPTLKSQWQHRRAALLLTDRKAFVTNYRATTMLLTCIAILAVDFPLYPRRLAKTETFGTGYMDLGVGSFVFSSGLSSRASRSSKPMAATSLSLSSAFSRIKALFLQCLPLLVLGTARLVVHKGLEYQEHVSEYGVHWNFFLTLACIHILSSLLRLCCPPTSLRLALSTILLVLYQFRLSWGHLATYVLEAPRDPASFYSMNREGILGVLGYLTLHLAAEQLGSTMIWPHHHTTSSTTAKVKNAGAQAWYTLFKIVVVDALLWFSVAVAQVVVQQPISRRLVNLPYVLWVAAYNTMMLAMVIAVDAFASIPSESDLMDAINRSQLALFLLANLLTGAVNLSIYTLYTPHSIAFIILLVYIGLVTSLFFYIHKVANITLKFW